MSRAALLAIGLGVIAPITSACSSDDSTDNGDDAGHDGSVTPAYGLAGDAGTDAMVGVLYGAPVTDASFALDGIAPAYGGFPGDAAMAIDANEEPDGSDAGDAGDAQPH